ncbi:MAG: carboxylesterase family protein [Chitinophagales bacterium]|nr:carboxylesterase family protein [Chitinophagales bacterium]
MKKQLLFFSIVCFFFSAFSQSNYCIQGRFSENLCFDSSDIKITTAVPYAVAKRWPSTTIDTLKLDVFEPTPATDTLSKRPFILLIHGGAFMAGNRADMHYQCMQYARRGFVVATISYRLGWNCAATDLLGVCIFCQGENFKLKTATYRAVQDARAALRYMTANAHAFGIDTSWIFIGGESAGSITALHTAFWTQDEADTFANWAKNDVGLLDTAGNSLANTYTIKAVIDNCGAVSRDSVVLNNGNIPVISFHDENDCVVPTAVGQVISCTCQSFFWSWGSSSIHSMMNNAGICNEMNLVPLSLNHCSYPTWNLVRHASCFLKRLMCSECAGGFSNNTSAAVSCDTLSKVVSSLPNIKLSRDAELFFFPNPTTGKVTFDVSNFLSQSPLNISVTDATGKLTEQHHHLSEPFFVTDAALYAQGIYFVAVYSGNRLLAKSKLIVQP